MGRKYKGKFDQGWDKLREETFARQKTLGVIPEDAQLRRHAEIPSWDDMPEALKPVLRRQMEVYAASWSTPTTMSDAARRPQALDISDDTLVYYIIGDNGALAEGTINGAYNEMANFNGLAGSRLPNPDGALEKLGGPDSYNHYAVGWAHAMNTPYQWTKQVASHWGGTRNDSIVSLAEGYSRRRARSVAVPPCHRRGADDPRGGGSTRTGLGQRRASAPDRGRQHALPFNDAKAAEQHETQYFEMFGNRGIYHKGWTAVTKHGTPWELLGERLCRSTMTFGSFTTRTKTGARRTISSSRCRRSCMNCSACG